MRNKKLSWKDLLGKKIVGLMGVTNGNGTPLRIILFDDKETYLELDEQDGYTYEDFNDNARTITLHRNPELWASMFNGGVPYRQASEANFIHI